MNEQFEINMKQARAEWQAKQNSCGLLVMTLIAASAIGFLNFLWAPSQASGVLLGGLVVALLAACIRMVICAAKVVEARHILQPVRPEVIDVEIVAAPRQSQSRQLTQYSARKF